MDIKTSVTTNRNKNKRNDSSYLIDRNEILTFSEDRTGPNKKKRAKIAIKE